MPISNKLSILVPFLMSGALSLNGCDSNEPQDTDTGASGGTESPATSTTGNSSSPASNSGGATSDSPMSGGGPGDDMTSTPNPATEGGNPDSDSSADGGQDSSTGDEPPPLEDFSFFVTSLASLQQISGNENGFGGNLSYDGQPGIAGADRICETLAEMSMPGAATKEWRAFLSTSGEDAIDRIGQGPWYDRNGRLFAEDIPDLMGDRPGGDPALADDFTNEWGVPNSAPDGEELDNHDTMTASNAQGRLQLEGSGNGPLGGDFSTCQDWTSAEPGQNPPAMGHSWPAQSGQSWMFVGRHGSGCEPLVWLEQTGSNCNGQSGVGCGGGYGGFYCFALTP